MAINTVLNTLGQATATFQLAQGQVANWSLSSAALTGFVTLEEGDTPNALQPLGAYPGNATGQASGPGIFRFRLSRLGGGQSVTVVVTDAITARQVVDRTVALSQAQYDALAPDPNTLYLITVT